MTDQTTMKSGQEMFIPFVLPQCRRCKRIVKKEIMGWSCEFCGFLLFDGSVEHIKTSIVNMSTTTS